LRKVRINTESKHEVICEILMLHNETDSAPEITEAVVLSWIFVRLLTKKFEIYKDKNDYYHTFKNLAKGLTKDKP